MTGQQTKTHSISRRTFLSGLAGATTLSWLAGCGTGATQGTTTLEFWGAIPAEQGPSQLIAAFEKAHPDIKVKYTRYIHDSTGNTKLETALAGSAPIDVFMSYDTDLMVKFIQTNLTEDLDSYINTDNALKQWTTSDPGVFKYQSKIFGLPTVKGTTYIYVNKNLVDAAGIKLPTQWTTDEFHSIAKQLSGKGVYGTYDTPDLAYAALGADDNYKNGGKASNFDHPIFRQSLELHRNMILEKSAFPWTEVLAQNLRVYYQSLFLKGQVAFASSSDFWHRYITDEKNYPHDFVTTFMPLPTPVGVKQPFSPGGPRIWIHITKKSRNKDAAWKFVHFNVVEGAQYAMLTGHIPVFPGANMDTVINGLLGPHKDKLYDVAAYKRVALDPNLKFALPTINTAASQIIQIAQAQTDRYLIGEISIDQWVATVKQQADDAIRKANT